MAGSNWLTGLERMTAKGVVDLMKIAVGRPLASFCVMVRWGGVEGGSVCWYSVWLNCEYG